MLKFILTIIPYGQKKSKNNKEQKFYTIIFMQSLQINEL